MGKKWQKLNVPIPGIEPGPSGWEPDILTTRQYGTADGEFAFKYEVDNSLDSQLSIWKYMLPYRESNPGLPGESRWS